MLGGGFEVATSGAGVLGFDGRAEVSFDHLEIELEGACVNLVVTRRDVLLVLEPGLLAVLAAALVGVGLDGELFVVEDEFAEFKAEDVF